MGQDDTVFKFIEDIPELIRMLIVVYFVSRFWIK